MNVCTTHHRPLRRRRVAKKRRSQTTAKKETANVPAPTPRAEGIPLPLPQTVDALNTDVSAYFQPQNTDMAAAITISTVTDLTSFLTRPAVLHLITFFAPWDAASCDGDGPLAAHIARIAALHADIALARADAEAPEVAEGVCDALSLTLSVVPTFVFLQRGTVVDRLEGSDTAALAAMMERLVKRTVSPTASPLLSAASDALRTRIEHLVCAAPMMAFIKGVRWRRVYWLQTCDALHSSLLPSSLPPPLAAAFQNASLRFSMDGVRLMARSMCSQMRPCAKPLRRTLIGPPSPWSL